MSFIKDKMSFIKDIYIWVYKGQNVVLLDTYTKTVQSCMLITKIQTTLLYKCQYTL